VHVERGRGSRRFREAAGSEAGEMITGAQIKAARELLGWTPWKLARSSQVPSAVIRRAESVDGEPTITVYQEALIRNALRDAGAEFTIGDEPGVKLRRPAPRGGGFRP
jgi:hypothetical protein